MTISEQIEKIRNDIYCHYQELTTLNFKKQNETNEKIESEIIRIHKLVIAKNALLKTLSEDWGQN